MIEPISCNCGTKRRLNFKGLENNNFTGVTSAVPSGGVLSEGKSVREGYQAAVQEVAETKTAFTAPEGAGAMIDKIV